MKIICLSILLFANLILAEQQVKLEDIERDNLANEREIQKDELIAQQTQHLRPPSIHASNQFSIQVHHDGSGQHEGNGGNGGGGGAVSSVSYHSGPSAPAAYPATGHGSNQVQYVTPTPSAYQAKDIISYTPQVHEEGRTYAVPARQSLVHPTIGGGIPTTKYFTPQPQYVYVQAQPQLQTYTQPQPFQHPQAAAYQQQLFIQQQPQAYVMVPSYVPSHVPVVVPKLQVQQLQHNNQQLIIQQQHQQQQQQQHLQHSQQQIIHHHQQQQQAAIPNVLSYSHGTVGQNNAATAGIVGSTTVKPDVSYVSSTVAPLVSHEKHVGVVKSVTPIQYYLQTAHNTGTSYHQHLQQHQHGQQYNTATGPVQYVSQPQQVHHQHIPAVQVQPIINHLPQLQYQQAYAAPAFQYHQQQQAAPIYAGQSYYNAYHHSRQPTSLLDSYVPSSIVYARQKGLLHASPYQQYATAASSPIYNTIAYSVPNYQVQPSVQTAQNLATHAHATHFKRSPSTATTSTANNNNSSNNNSNKKA